MRVILRYLALLPFVVPAGASAQAPLRHFTEAVDLRTSPRHPVVSYRLRVDAADLAGFAVELRIRNAPDTIRLAMAAHPEYDDRYWRYLRDVRAEGANGGALRIVREDSMVWRVHAPGGVATVRYRLVLPTPAESPRASWRPFLSPTGGLVGGPHGFLYLLGATLAPAHVVLDLPAGWDVATGLQRTVDARTYFAPTVDALVDAPILVGRLRHWRFAIDGVPHHVAYWPKPGAAPFDTLALTGGIERIAREAVERFGRPPYRDFTFLVQDDAYGGLEHRNSTTLGASGDLLARGDFVDFFGDLAHEFTHTWNLMRIRPAEYGDVSHRTQRPVSSLWFSEGLTLHYADLFLRRARIPADSTPMAHLERILQRHVEQPGYARLSAEQISRVEYNSRPAALGDYQVGSHLVGELLGALLDFTIRGTTANRRSMDDVMRLMLARHSGVRGFTGRDVERAVTDVCGCDVSALFAGHVRGAGAMDYDRYLRHAGLRAVVRWGPAVDGEGRLATDMRLRAFTPEDGGRPELWILDPTSSWRRAGLRSGDRLVSIDDRPMANWRDLRGVMSTARLGDTLRVEVLRPAGPFRTSMVVTGYQRPTVRLEPRADATPAQRDVLAAWLAERRPAPDGR